MVLPSTIDAGVRSGLNLARRFLAAEIRRLRAAGVPAAQDEYRGLYVADAEADRLLALAGEEAPFAEFGLLREELAALHACCPGRLDRLVGTLALAPFDLGCLLLCLLTEADLDSERLLAYAQDDVSKRRPRVDLALRLFEGVPGGPARDQLAPNATLRRLRLLRLFDEPGQPFTPIAARSMALDERIAAFLLGSNAMDAVLKGHATFVTAAEVSEIPRTAAWAPITRVSELDDTARPGLIGLMGRDLELLTAAASALQPGSSGLLRVNLGSLKEGRELEEAFILAAREARLQGAGLCLSGLDTLTPAESETLLGSITRETWARPAVLVAGPTFRWPHVTLDVPDLDYEGRRALWREAVADTTHEKLDGEALDAVAGRFKLPTRAIADAAERARSIALTRDAAESAVQLEDLLAGARSQSTPILSGLAKKVVPHNRWEDIILAPDTTEQLQEMCAHVEHRHLVYEAWGFERKLASSKGLMSLFAGQSGTGKTMAADVVANTLGLDLYRIDLSAMVSKYIGETEKNLAAVFSEAETSNAVLFFDEADALFGKRSEVKDAHDRYANIETAYLLQRMEEYDGVVILATNLKMNLDEAFLRRLHFVVDFPMPDELQRKRIWQGAVPREAPLQPGVDWDFLARQFKISGGNIRNAVLAAAFLAASEGVHIGTSHLVRGVRREYQKLGRMISDAEFGPFAQLVRGNGG